MLEFLQKNKLKITLTGIFLTGILLFPQSDAIGQSTASQLDSLRQQVNKLQQVLIKRGGQPVTDAFGESSNALDIVTDLSLGDRGPEVRRLQEALNDVSGILVATFGPGSPGQETSYFGPKTKRAVEKLQAKYASDILFPVGLSSPTGYFGTQTRKKLAQIINNTQTQQSDVSQPTSDSLTQNTDTQNTNDQQATSDSQEKSMSDLRNEFSITKWSFTKEEKQRIYDMMPSEIQEKHFSDFLENTTESNNNEDSTETPTNPLQDRYQQLQNSNDTSFKKWVKGRLALRNLFKPLGLLRKNLTDVFGAEIAHAQGFFVFGGRIASVEPCPTPPNALQVTVAGVRPGRFAFIPAATQLRPVAAGVPRPGMSTLGSYTPVPGCYGPPPALAPLTQGTIIQMGVSQI